MTEFYKLTKLSDGVYQGKQSGYKVVLDIGIMFHVENGLRGINIPVEVTITNGNAAVKVLDV